MTGCGGVEYPRVECPPVPFPMESFILSMLSPSQQEALGKVQAALLQDPHCLDNEHASRAPTTIPQPTRAGEENA